MGLGSHSMACPCPGGSDTGPRAAQCPAWEGFPEPRHAGSSRANRKGFRMGTKADATCRIPAAMLKRSSFMLAGRDSLNVFTSGLGTVSLSLMLVKEVTDGDGPVVPSVINPVDTGCHIREGRPVDRAHPYHRDRLWAVTDSLRTNGFHASLQAHTAGHLEHEAGVPLRSSAPASGGPGPPRGLGDQTAPCGWWRQVPWGPVGCASGRSSIPRDFAAVFVPLDPVIHAPASPPPGASARRGRPSEVVPMPGGSGPPR